MPAATTGRPASPVQRTRLDREERASKLRGAPWETHASSASVLLTLTEHTAYYTTGRLFFFGEVIVLPEDHDALAEVSLEEEEEEVCARAAADAA